MSYSGEMNVLGWRCVSRVKDGVGRQMMMKREFGNERKCGEQSAEEHRGKIKTCVEMLDKKNGRHFVR